MTHAKCGIQVIYFGMQLWLPYNYGVTSHIPSNLTPEPRITLIARAYSSGEALTKI